MGAKVGMFIDIVGTALILTLVLTNSSGFSSAVQSGASAFSSVYSSLTLSAKPTG